MENYDNKSHRKIIRRCLYNIINHPSQIAQYFTKFILNRNIIIRPLEQILPNRYQEYGLYGEVGECLGYFVNPRIILVNMNQSELEIEKTIIHEIQHYYYHHEAIDENSSVIYNSVEDERIAQLSECEYEYESPISYNNFLQNNLNLGYEYSKSEENLKKPSFELLGWLIITVIFIYWYLYTGNI